MCHRDYTPQTSNGLPSSHPHHLLDCWDYACDDIDDDQGKPIVHRCRLMTPSSSFHLYSPLPSVGGDNVHEKCEGVSV